MTQPKEKIDVSQVSWIAANGWIFTLDGTAYNPLHYEVEGFIYSPENARFVAYEIQEVMLTEQPETDETTT